MNTRCSTASPGPIKLLRDAGNVAKLRLHAGNMKFNKQNVEMNAYTYNYFTFIIRPISPVYFSMHRAKQNILIATGLICKRNEVHNLEVDVLIQLYPIS
jgi:hypothetical protein